MTGVVSNVRYVDKGLTEASTSRSIRAMLASVLTAPVRFDPVGRLTRPRSSRARLASPLNPVRSSRAIRPLPRPLRYEDDER
jgi:hypothetical protein